MEAWPACAAMTVRWRPSTVFAVKARTVCLSYRLRPTPELHSQIIEVLLVGGDSPGSKGRAQEMMGSTQ
jgi:hypothetical protein